MIEDIKKWLKGLVLWYMAKLWDKTHEFRVTIAGTPYTVFPGRHGPFVVSEGKPLLSRNYSEDRIEIQPKDLTYLHRFTKQGSRVYPLEQLQIDGIILEANRQFFHPLGLVLTVYYDRDDPDNNWGIYPGSAIPIGVCVADYRDQPDGIAFESFNWGDLEKIEKVAKIRADKAGPRIEKWGTEIQPVKISEVGATPKSRRHTGVISE